MNRFLLPIFNFASLLSLLVSVKASEFELIGINQQTQAGFYDGLYRSAVYIRIQNGSPGAPDYGGGVGTASEAIVDMGSLLGHVVDKIVERHPEFNDHDAVWNSLLFDILRQGEIYGGWLYEFDEYVSNLAQYSFGEPGEFEHYLVFRNMGGPSDLWNNYNTDPDNDSLTFLIHLTDLLDFDQDGRVDPDEILIWDGRTGGSYPNDYKPSVASPVTVPEGSGFYLHAGISRQGGPIPILSIQDSYTFGEVIETESGTPSALNFTAERANAYGYYRWIYIVQHSTDLKAWTNQAPYPGNGQAVSHPIATDGTGFWRILIANEKDYQAFDLAPADQTINAPTQTFTWKGAEAAIRYELYLSTDAVIDSSDLVASTTATSCEITTLAPGSTYYWQVVAIFADELDVASDPASFSTHAP